MAAESHGLAALPVASQLKAARQLQRHDLEATLVAHRRPCWLLLIVIPRLLRYYYKPTTGRRRQQQAGSNLAFLLRICTSRQVVSTSRTTTKVSRLSSGLTWFQPTERRRIEAKKEKRFFFPISFIAVSRSLHQTNTHNLFRVPVFALCSCVFFFDDCTPQWKLHSLLILLFEYPHYLHPIFLFTCSTVVDCQYRARVITIWLFIHLLTPPSYTNRLDIHSFIRHQKIKRNPWFFLVFFLRIVLSCF